ncbi:MAG TPA: YfbM family protein [Patescibacteria group bacterium]|nr:YfbM family protein [Patescibacteria group bacterium]
MGMVGSLLRVNLTELQNYIQDSRLLVEVLFPESDHLSESNHPNLLELDKMWGGVCFLFTKHSFSDADDILPPLSWIFLSGKPIKELDFGCGPAFYLMPEQVIELNKILENISVEDLKQNFNSQVMMDEGVYPAIWDKDPKILEFLLEYAINLKSFYNEAAINQQAVITYLN